MSDLFITYLIVYGVGDRLNDGLEDWISVEDKVPGRMCHVLCACIGGYVGVSFYNPALNMNETKRGRKAFGKFGRHFDLCDVGHRVTHWMPLPKPPNV